MDGRASNTDPIPFKIENFETGENLELELDDSSTAAKIDKGHLFVLTYDGVEKWDLENKQRVDKWKTSQFEQAKLRYKEHPTDMEIYKDRIYLSHGRLGMTVLDATTGELLKMINPLGDQAPHESQATAIGRVGSKIIMTWDNFTLSRQEKASFPRTYCLQYQKREVHL